MHKECEVIIRKIKKEIEKNKIDWQLVEELVKKLGPNINELYHEKISILAHFIQDYINGEVTLKLVKLFLDNGFDVHKNEKINGSSCLEYLCWSSGDNYILKIGELLLDEGADSTIPMKDDCEEIGVLDTINCSLGDWRVGNYYRANTISAYYEMIKRQQDGKDYHGIRTIEDAVGLRITKVEKIAIEEKMPEDSSFETLIFWSNDIPVTVNKQAEIFIFPQVLENAKERADVSNEFDEIVDKRISGIQFTSITSLRINFEDGTYVIISDDIIMGDSETNETRYRIAKKDEAFNLNSGEAICNIYFMDEDTYAYSAREYFIRDCFLQMENGKIYHIYSKITHSKAKLRFEVFDFDMCKKLQKRIVGSQFRISGVGRNQQAYKWLEIMHDRGYIYLVPVANESNRSEIALMISEEKIDRKKLDIMSNTEPEAYYSPEAKLKPLEVEYVKIEHSPT